MSTTSLTPPLGGAAVAAGRLGEYHLVKKIGQGGMGTIYLAKRLGVGGFEKTFVIKCMLESLADDQEAQAMFIDEARLAARLTHPNIAQIYDFGVINGTYYIAMEHIAGEDLRAINTRLRERRLKAPVPIALRLMRDLCAGLDYAHTLADEGAPLGIVHRDVSPANIMVSYQGTVKLLDFGIAKATSRLSSTNTGKLKGKLSYLAPEQINDTAVDGRADVFCLGITMYLLLVQRHPWRRETEVATMNAIARDPVPDPRGYRDNLPEDVVQIVLRSLEQDPERRFRNAAEMGAALNDALARLAPGLGDSDVSSFMLALFGKQAMESRTRVPTLIELPIAAVRKASLVAPANPPEPDDDDDTDQADGTPTTLEVPAYVPGEKPTRLPWTKLAVGVMGVIGVAALLSLAMPRRAAVAPAAGPAKPVAARPAPGPLPPQYVFVTPVTDPQGPGPGTSQLDRPVVPATSTTEPPAPRGPVASGAGPPLRNACRSIASACRPWSRRRIRASPAAFASTARACRCPAGK